MLISYIKTSLRNLWKRRGYTGLNIAGLAVGLACCLLIALYVRYEWSFDRYHAHADRLYRLTIDFSASKRLAMVGPPVAGELKAEYPEIEDAGRFVQTTALFHRSNDPAIQYQENNALYGDPSVLNMFSFGWISGDRMTALSSPFSLVLTQSAARRYFGAENPVGRVLLSDGRPFTVTGVMTDVPANSHFTFDVLISLATGNIVFPDFMNEWWALSAHSYIQLAPGADIADLEKQFSAYIQRRIGSDLEPGGEAPVLSAEALTDIYLKSDYHSSLSRSGDLSVLYIFTGIALFILLIACINFMNLATACASDRAKEIGVRKAIGAYRRQLAGQFLCESLIMAGMAFVLGLLIVELSLPAFSTQFGMLLTLDVFYHPAAVTFGLIGVLLVGLLAGAYPAFVMSGFRPVAAIQGVTRSPFQAIVLRKGLVVFQFTLSMSLIVCTGMVFSQIDYMRNKDLGFDTQQMVTVRFYGDEAVRNNMDALKREFLKHPAVQAVTASGDIPGIGNLHSGITIENREGEMQNEAWRFMAIDPDFIPAYGMEMAAGRPFTADISDDAGPGLLINETAATQLGYLRPEQALGRMFDFEDRLQGEITGVVRDFHLKSLQQPVEPTYLLISPERNRYVSLRLQSSDIRQTIAELERIWLAMVPHRPFDYLFIDDTFQRMYQSDEQFGRIVGLFTTLALFVAGLGLFGLSALMIRQRAKEIGVRKVLGASTAGLIALMTGEFTRLILIAFAAAAPAVYLLINKWLAYYPYRTEFDFLLLVFAGIIGWGTALLITGWHAIRTARINPINTLKSE